MSKLRFGAGIFFAVLSCAISSFAQERAASPAAKDQVKTAGRDGVSVPQCVSCPMAEYSEKGRKAKIQGTVELAIVVGADGAVREASVTKGLGYGLDESALKAVKKWRLKPAVDRDGNPVATKMAVQMAFRFY